MFARRGPFVTIANRKIKVVAGVKDVDYHIDGVGSGILLYTADTEQLSKGKRHVVTLSAKIQPLDRYLMVKVNHILLSLAEVTGPILIGPEDTGGEVVLHITPRVDINISDLDYIVKLLAEIKQ